MPHSINKNGWLIMAFTLAVSFCCSASAKQKLSFAGFASQGVVYTSNNTFFDDDGDASIKMTELALQANYVFDGNLRLSGQGIYRNWGKTQSLLVDYLMIDYQMALANSNNIGIRLGRIKSDLGLVNSTRDIPNARPSIFLPQSVYQDILRDTTTSYDGASLYGNLPLYQGRLSWSLAYGTYPSSSNLNQNILAEEFAASIKPKANIQLMATWESPKADWLISLGFENPNAKLNGNEAAPIFSISDGEIMYDRYLLSTQYFDEYWDFTFEYMSQATEIEGFNVMYYGELIPQSSQTEYMSDGYYGQWRYIVNENITALLRYGRYATDNDDRKGKAYNISTLYQNPAHIRYHHDLTLGLKWEISAHWLLHTEAHFIEGTAAIAPIIKLDHSLNAHKNWHLLSAQLSYSF